MKNTAPLATFPETPMTVEQAAARLGISHMSIRRYMRTGRLPVRRLGREYFLYPDDLRTLIRPEMGRPRKSAGPVPDAQR